MRRSPSLAQRIRSLFIWKKLQNSVANVLWQKRDGRSSRNNGLEVIPATTNATAVSFDEFSERNTHFFLNCAWVVHVAWDTEKFGSVIVFSSKRWEPARSSATNSDGFSQNNYLLMMVGQTATVSTLVTVVGQPYKPTLAGNGGFSLGFPWLPSRLSIRAYRKKSKAFFAIAGINYGFLSADIGTSTVVDINIEVVSTSASILSNQSLFICLKSYF
mgnify:FL=1